MEDPVPDLLGSALVPKLGADITAGAAGYVHFALIPVAALGAGPDQLAIGVFLDFNFSVIATDLAVVGLGVQLSVHDVFVNELHDLQHGIDVALHVGDLHVTDGAAGAEALELRFEGQLGKGVDGLQTRGRGRSW